MTGATTALVRNDHFLNETSFHGMSRSNAGGVGEIARVTNKKCFVGNVDLNITASSRSGSIRRAILRHSLEARAPASAGLPSWNQTMLNNASNIAPMRCMPDKVKE